MPHAIVEYSANLDATVDIQDLLDRIADTMIETGVFPIGGTRVRAARRDAYAIADRFPANSFVHVTIRMGTGRDEGTRRGAAEAIFGTVTDFFADDFEQIPLGLSLEVVEIDPSTSFKKNNMHEIVAARATEHRDPPAPDNVAMQPDHRDPNPEDGET